MDAPVIKLTVDEDELLRLSGYDSRGWLEKWLVQNRIKYFSGKDGQIFTTVGLLEAAKSPQYQGSTSSERIEF